MHATALPVASEVQPEVEAIEQHRRLLDDPDPAPGLVDKVTQALRAALNQAHCPMPAPAAGGEEHPDRLSRLAEAYA